MKEKKAPVKWILFVLFLAVASLSVYRTYRILSWKDTMGPFMSSADQFYNTEKGLIDAAFFGSSHGYAGVRPGVIWKDYGYATFNFSVSGQDKISTVHYIRELLKRHTPQVVFVDLYATEYERHGVLSNMYRNMLSLRLSPNQISLINAYYPKEERMNYYLKWPIIHTRYRELQPYDFYDSPVNRYGRGADYSFRNDDTYLKQSVTSVPGAMEASESNQAFIDDLAEIQNETGVTVIPVVLPFIAMEETQRMLNGIMQYAEEKGLTCIDFNQMYDELELITEVDFADWGHLNSYGAEKVSRWLGAYLQEHFTIPDHRGDAAYWQWDEDVLYEEHALFKKQLGDTSKWSPFANAAAEGEELVILLCLPEGFGDQKNQVEKTAELLGLPEDFAANGGVCIIDDGVVNINMPLQEEGSGSYDIDRRHTVWAEGKKAFDTELSTGEVSMRMVWQLGMGTEVLFDSDQAEGMGVIVYDKRMEAVIYRKTFAYSELYIF
ncbi:MAG: hypothetical protein IJP92_16885 [Lachnospiraceae bacterium]|nr:hypothetical protein [Lachnospiraceae bacterium]